MARDWDAAAYDRLPVPMTRWGQAVVGWLELNGDERILDAGCGTGKVTAFLLERLPRGKVVALDGSKAMIEIARERLGNDERVQFVVADLERPLRLTAPVDAILSTATFHWIPDHDALFRNLAGVLKPGGLLAAQCGGAGNIASIGTALSDIGVGSTGRKNFATPEETTSRLTSAGFMEVDCWLQPEPTPLDPADLELYLETICLGDLVTDMAPGARAAFVAEVARRLPNPVIDYVRLNIRARRAG
jgi:trans-aconitate 2-methyltransferase